MTEPLYLDIETYCDLDLKKVGVYRYVEHPSFRILMCAWAIGDGPVEVETNEADIALIPGLLDPDVIKVAHNAAFERVCFSARIARLPVGTYLPPEQYRDTQAIARELGWPPRLELLGKALGISEKDSAGTRLINLFSKPYRGRRVMPEERPVQWEEFKRYCAQDVVTMREADHVLGDWPTNRERLIYMADQHINDYGIKVDLPLARRAHRAALSNALIHEAEFRSLTGVSNPNSNVQVMAWARQEGLPLPNLKAETVQHVLDTESLTGAQRRALELRQELALVAAKKFSAALGSTNGDGRLRGTLVFHGAHTGRWAGKGLQPHNLPRAKFSEVADETDAILELMTEGTADPLTLKRLVRPMFVGPLTVVDYKSIEAFVVAWLSGEEWVLQAARDGRDIYVETASRMGGLTRPQGKVAVLALGYNGGPNSLRVMASDSDVFAPEGKRPKRIVSMTDEELYTHFVYPWRNANPSTRRFWKQLDEAFRMGAGRVGPGRISLERKGDDRHIRLPSGRRLRYHDVRPGDRRITFRDWSRQGVRSDTYGGRLTENVTQAVARDIMAEALVRLERNGFHPVAHVHDEILVEGHHSVEQIIEIMCQPPRWAQDLPIAAEGFTCHRYRKG